MMYKKLLFLLIFVSLAIIFHNNGWIDLAVSRKFYNKAQGFYLKDNWFAILVYRIVPVIVGAFILGAIALSIRIYLQTKSFNLKYYAKIMYVMLVCMVGPGLIVNFCFKENFGRARPLQVHEFGGAAKFTPAFVVANQCSHNCSFVSGHASIGFVFFVFAFINHGRKRFCYNILAITLGMLIGFGRIIRGSHFLSDVIFSGFFVYMTSYTLAKIFEMLHVENFNQNQHL